MVHRQIYNEKMISYVFNKDRVNEFLLYLTVSEKIVHSELFRISVSNMLIPLNSLLLPDTNEHCFIVSFGAVLFPRTL